MTKTSSQQKKAKKASSSANNGKKVHFKKMIMAVTKEIHPDLSGVSKKATMVLESMLMFLLDRVAMEAIAICRKIKKKTITSREINSAVKLLMPNELGKHARSEMTKELTDIGVYGSHEGNIGSEFLKAAPNTATPSPEALSEIVEKLHGNPNAKQFSRDLHSTYQIIQFERFCAAVRDYVEMKYEEALARGTSNSDELSDFKLEIALETLAEIQDADIFVLEWLRNTFAARIDKVVIRRSCCYGKHINFHVDSALKTMQVALNSRGDDYEGGKLVYIVKNRLLIPKRSLGSIFIHRNDILHGVTEMVRGVKYGLFFLKLRGPEDHDSDSENEVPKQESSKMPSRLQVKASAVERLLRRFTATFRLAPAASIAVAALLEYISAEILELAGNSCKVAKKKRITPSHIKKAIFDDEELSHLFDDCTISCHS